MSPFIITKESGKPFRRTRISNFPNKRWFMKNLTSRSILFFKCSILIILLSGCFGAPDIKFEETAFDFGICDQKITVSHVFKFTNTGDGSLHIDDVKAG